MRRSILLSLTASLWALVVAVAMLLPGARVPAVSQSWADKAAHLALFLVLAWLLAAALGRGRWRLAAALAALYALLLELAQIAVPGRAFELLDLVAAFVGVALASLARRRRRGAVGG